ncbi:amidohydrolase family protein [Paenibacillus kobensis]|uniref:amidohydrolase family protein n=1 Tax=Paenibacillus kobensis TaxID=59841 RepID=UPI000FD6CEDA|nr:amidohydrolase family protein [Paenibacillus kobensis]
MEQNRHRRRFRTMNVVAAGLAAVVVIVAWVLWGDRDGGGDAGSDRTTKSAQTQNSSRGGTDSAANSANGNGAPPQSDSETGEVLSATALTGAVFAESQLSKADTSRTYDIVIRGGRVINPETMLDAVMNVGIIGGQIGAVTAKPLSGKRTIEAKGLVVAPGFIDNLSYDPNPLGVWNKIADGVTSNIAMHGGTSTPDKWYSYYERNETPLHFGASFFYSQARNQFKISRYDGANEEQIRKLRDQAEKALNDGALGISFSLEYVPGIEAPEIVPLMELAHEYNVPVYFHARYSDMEEPGTNIDALKELIGYARLTGAAVHIDHINSTGGTFSMKQSLAMVDAARAEGLDITACIYPYDYWGTYLNSARFDEGWQERFRITYHDLQLAGSTERLTQETFTQYKKEGKLAVAYAIPPEDIEESIKPAYVMIGSDAILEPGLNNHPRASGTFARTIGLYARDKGVISLMDAIAKTSLLPAQRLEKQAPALKKKGRVEKGMDADLVVFDYDTIIDKSTVEHPDLYSSGIQYVFIAGKPVLDDGKLNKRIHVGEPVRSRFERVGQASDGGQLRWKGETAEYSLLLYGKQRYIDLNALASHGYKLSWDKVTKVYTVAEGVADVPDDQLALAMHRPAEGTLLLERGYYAKAGGNTADVLSAGDRAFVPVEWLTDLGMKLISEGDKWTVRRE